jgi:glucuronoarabinoxylan endo-1,4-beta-xylanase
LRGLALPSLALSLLTAIGCGGGTTGGGVTVLPTAATVTVDLSTTYQTMVGFGAAVAYYDGSATANPMSAELYQTIFSDLGLEVLRIGNWYQNNNDNEGSFKSTAAFVNGAHQLGYTPIILMSSWNPPFTSWPSADGSTTYPSLKSNGMNDAGGTLPQTSSGVYDYADFGTWWAQSLIAYAAAGVVPDYISIQNEPDFTTTNEGTCLLDPTESATNAGYGPALDAVKTALAATPGLTMPKFIGPENDSLAKTEFERYMSGITASNDLDDLDAVAHHLYGSGDDGFPNSYDSSLSDAAAAAAGKPIWQSEYAPTDENFFTTAWLIQNSVTVEGVSTYLYWDLYWPAQSSPSGLVTVTSTGFTINDDYYAVQHFAKGIATGWTRVGAAATENIITVSAYLSPDGTQLTLVLLNIDGADHQVTIDPGAFAGATSSVYRSTSMTSERYAAIGPLDAANSFDMPPQSLATVTLSP